MTSPRTSTESANTETNSASTSKLRSWSTPWEKSSVCAGSARGPEPGPLLRSATPTASPTQADSPPTPGSHPSTGNQAPATTRKSRGGNHRLKNAMFQAAFVASQHDPDARVPTKTSRRQTPQRRRHLRRPQTLRHHLSHAQNPNPLPTNTTPTPTPSRLKRLDNKTGTPPPRRGSS